MAYNHVMDPINSKEKSSPSGEFHPYAWSQVDNKRALDVEGDNGVPSPKRLVMEFSPQTDEDDDSPVVIHINSGENLVVTGDSDPTIAEAAKQTMPFIESTESRPGPITEDNIIRDRAEEYSDPVEINGFPVYKLRKRAQFLNETLELCMGININKDTLCHQVPTGILVSAIFVVDFQSIHHHDVVAKDKSCFGRQSSPTRHVALKIGVNRNIVDIKTIKFFSESMVPDNGFDFYKIRRHYTWHKYIPGLSRIITRLEYKNELFRYGVVQFKLSEEDKSFASNFKPSSLTHEKDFPNKFKPATPTDVYVQRQSPRPLQEPTRTIPIRPQPSQNIAPKPSALNSSTTAASNSIPKTPPPQPQASSPSSCKNEIFNILKNADRPRPKLSKVPDFSKLLSLLKCGEFLCDVSFCTTEGADKVKELHPRTFAMGEMQRHWLQSYCTGPNSKSIVNISTLQKIGNMHLTALTCALPVFVLKDDPSKYPTVLLALMTSLTNDKQDYEYLASNLKRQGITQMNYGTAGVGSLDEVLERNFPATGLNGSVHLCCFNKVKEMVLEKLESLKLKAEVKQLITKQIFGFELENSADCLLDQKTESQFRDMWAKMETSWPAPFRDWMRKPQADGERCFLDTLRYSMLRPVRVLAGLGDPPKKYVNVTDNQGITDAITELELEPKDSIDLSKVHDVFRSRAVDAQITDFVKAMYNMGQVRLAKEYQHLTVSLFNVDQ